MANEFTFDRSHTVVLVLDYQIEIVSLLPDEVQVPLLQRTANLLKAARKANLPVVYVVVRFRDGYPELSPRNLGFQGLKETGRLREGQPGTEICPMVAPQLGELVLVKRRVGAFSSTELESLLRAQGFTTLVLLGVATSGVVLSTVRWAADLDYRLVVVGDACANRDAEVHQVLLEKIFPRQAAVVTTAEFIKAIG